MKSPEMEKSVMEEIKKLQSEQNVVGVLVSERSGLCVYSSGETKPENSGHISFMANHISKLDKHEPYPTIILKSDNKSCLIKGSERACISMIYQNKQ